MIGEAIGTVVTLGWALAAWIAAGALVVAVVLHSLAAAVWWAWRTAWRGVTASLSLVQHSSAPELPHAPPGPSNAHTEPHAPSWARTDKDAA